MDLESPFQLLILIGLAVTLAAWAVQAVKEFLK
jgi:hypothetical protein